jgi:hypothetical protein
MVSVMYGLSVRKIKVKLLFFPFLGIFISVFPQVVIVPVEALLGRGTHLSLGDLIVLCLPLLTLTYSFIMAFYQLLKEQFKTMFALILLGAAQVVLSVVEWGFIG